MSPSVSHAPWRGAAVGTVCEIAGVAFRISSADSESVPYYPLPSRRSRPLRPVTVVRPRRPGAPRAPRWRLSSRATPRATVSTRFIQQCRAHGRASSCAIVGGFRAISRQRPERARIYFYIYYGSLSAPACNLRKPGRVAAPARPTVSGGAAQRLPHTVCDDSAAAARGGPRPRQEVLHWRHQVVTPGRAPVTPARERVAPGRDACA